MGWTIRRNLCSNEKVSKLPHLSKFNRTCGKKDVKVPHLSKLPRVTLREKGLLRYDKFKSLLTSKCRMKKVQENSFIQTEPNFDVEVSLVSHYHYLPVQ